MGCDERTAIVPQVRHEVACAARSRRGAIGLAAQPAVSGCLGCRGRRLEAPIRERVTDEAAPVAIAVSIFGAQMERANGQEWTLLQDDRHEIHLALIIGPAALYLEALARFFNRAAEDGDESFVEFGRIPDGEHSPQRCPIRRTGCSRET